MLYVKIKQFSQISFFISTHLLNNNIIIIIAFQYFQMNEYYYYYGVSMFK